MIPSMMLPELGLEHKIVVHYEMMEKNSREYTAMFSQPDMAMD